MKDHQSDEFTKAIRKRAIQAVLACALCWGVGTAVMIIGAFLFLTEAIGILIAALLYAIILLIPVFQFRLLQLGSFEGRIVDIGYQRRYKLYMIKPVDEHAVQYRSEYTLYIQKDNGKVTTVTYLFKEWGYELLYRKGDRVRYRWGVPYMEILSTEEEHAAICPFCAKENPVGTVECCNCHRPIVDEHARSSFAKEKMRR